MTICRYSVTLVLFTTACTLGSPNKDDDHSLLINANGRSYTIEELIAEDHENPNRLSVLRDIQVEGEIEFVPQFRTEGIASLLGYELPLAVGEQSNEDFHAELAMRDFTVDEAARLDPGQTVTARCETLGVDRHYQTDELVGLTFSGCTLT